ncbi:MAG TPA: hypothetical protein VG942_10625 [Hyphomonadaceae bacterium]|nr:hypothetical protein [Hyphomonadaceae bacterium]
MKRARWIFLVAGIYGILILAPGFFLEQVANASDPPPITHPEFYYGFYGSALVWQLVFLAIWRWPEKLRVLIPITILEKLAFFAASLALYFTGRMAIAGPFIGGMIDGFWMVMFAVAWFAGKPKAA